MNISIKAKTSWLIPLFIMGGLLSITWWGSQTVIELFSRTLQYCQTLVVFHFGQNPVFMVLVSLLSLLVIVGLFKSAKFLISEYRRSHKIKTYLSFLKVSETLDTVLVKAPEALAFTIGWLKPKVIYTTKLVEVLDNKELEAVLSHEEAHRLKRDPLRRLIAKSLSELFFFIPLMQDMADNFALHQEFRADKKAAKKFGRPVLLSGMKKLVSQALDDSLGVTVCPILSVGNRLERLKGGPISFNFQFSLKNIVTSLTFILLTTVMLLNSLTVQASPVEEAQICEAALIQQQVLMDIEPPMTFQQLNMTKINNSFLILN